MILPIDSKKDCIFTIFEITSLKYFFRYGRIRPSGGYRGVVQNEREQHKNASVFDFFHLNFSQRICVRATVGATAGAIAGATARATAGAK
jgi:hypothetical protein